MPFILVRHKVADYTKWRPVYDEHGAARSAAGAKHARLFRSEENPNEIIILMEWDDLNKARQFTQSQDLKEAMMRAGVIEMPSIYFLEEIK